MIGRIFGPYEIVSLLGAGGMGEVYLAQDTRLGRRIALKLLPARFTQDSDRLRRFEQEARTASALNHPGIVTIYDIGTTDGHHFIATELVEGQTLRQRMTREAMTTGEALDIAAQIANALAAAHAAGVVHRDIKPENIMLRADGYVKVLDFGIAKLTEAIDPGADTVRGVLTETGVVMGTTRYMSPEQARGLGVDARADLFSLGVVLYEMIAGRPPFDGRTASDVLVEILHRQPSPLARFSTDVSAELERIVTKTLRKNQEERYQTARDLQLDLKSLAKDVESGVSRPGSGVAEPGAVDRVSRFKTHRVAALLVTGLVVVAAAAAIYFWPTPGAIDSLAVLPLVNVSHDTEADYLADGISESVMNRLGHLPHLRLASFASASRYKDKSQTDLETVGKELGVSAVLSGRMTKRGDMLTFSVELVDVRTNGRLWGETYSNRRQADLIQVQDEIAQEISAALRLRLTGDEERRLATHETENTEAFTLYWQGRFYWNKFTEEGFRKSIPYFEQAVALDGNYALAYAGLADAYSLLGEMGSSQPADMFPKGRAYADKALTLDESLAAAHVSKAVVKLFYDYDWDGAERALKRAQALQPRNADAYHFRGHYLQMMGRGAESVVETQKGVDYEPASLILNAELANSLLLAGRYEPAIAQAQKTLSLDPGFLLASVIIAQAYGKLGRYPEAIAELTRVRALSKEWGWVVSELGYVYAKSGNRAGAEELLRQLTKRRATEYIDPFLIVQIYAGLGDKERTLAWLERSFQEKSGILPWLKLDVHLDFVRSEPRFADIVARMQLPPS